MFLFLFVQGYCLIHIVYIFNALRHFFFMVWYPLAAILINSDRIFSNSFSFSHDLWFTFACLINHFSKGWGYGLGKTIFVFCIWICLTVSTFWVFSYNAHPVQVESLCRILFFCREIVKDAGLPNELGKIFLFISVKR